VNPAEPVVEPGRGETRWRARAVERSLREARARATSRSDAFLQAATELLSETGGTDFTVQELTARAGLSLRSFYQHFAGKDELLLALFEQVIRDYAATVRQKVERFDDPVDRLRACVLDLYETADAVGSSGTLFARALALHHQHLAGTQPAEVAHALYPQVELVREVIEAGAAAGRFRTDVDAHQLATIVSQTLIGVAHMNVLGTHVTGVQVDPAQLWAFCLAGVSPPAPGAGKADRSEIGAGPARRRPRRTDRDGGGSWSSS
jgi:AcrR family transcriptional regulator